MVKNLRRKFVTVTTSLMVVVFGLLFTINTLHNSYWTNLEIVSVLNWIAHSGIFTSMEELKLNDEFVLNVIDVERPIIGIILDKNGNVISERVIGVDQEESEKISVDEDIITEMLDRGSREHKIGEYYYSYNTFDDDKILLVVMDNRFRGSILLWWLGIIGFTGLCILALLGITFFLSRYVTEPAEQSLIREKRFISDASHELKTPLGAISINAQALEIDSPDNLYLKNIISESNRMSRLIEKLLMLSKYDEAEIVGHEKLNLSEICDEMALTYEAVAYEKKITFLYEIEHGIFVTGNEDEIRQLLAILFDNAIKNTNVNGLIELKCNEEHGHVHISVSNTGEGIGQDDIPHVFERFYTTDKSRKNSSFGLGLAIAKSIVERHGGTIEVSSKLNEKTEFNVHI